MSDTAESVPFVRFYAVTVDADIRGPLERTSEKAPTGHVAVRECGRPEILFLQGDLPAFSSWALARRFQIFAREAAKRTANGSGLGHDLGCNGLHGLHEFASRHRDQSVQNYVAQAHRACHENPVSTGPEQEEPVDRVTEDEGQANRTGVCQTKDCWMNRTITGLPQIGSISLHDYIAMVHPGSMLASKRALLWMLFSFFVAGLLAGLLMGKVLA